MLRIALPEGRSPQPMFISFIWMFFAGISIAYAQQTDSIRREPFKFSVQSSVTNNGISIIPSFSLGKPAGVVEMSMGRRLTFDPQYRFSLSGEPWSVIFWLRYKFVQSQRFRFSAGVHPAMMFNTISDPGRSPSFALGARRFFAMELSPYLQLNPHFGLGMYYLQSRGLKETGGMVVQFLNLNARLSNIPLRHSFYVNLDPQMFMLRSNEHTGYFAAATLTISHHKIPWSVQTLHNVRLKGQVPGAQPHVWNVSLIHSFVRKYHRLSQ